MVRSIKFLVVDPHGQPVLSLGTFRSSSLTITLILKLDDDSLAYRRFRGNNGIL